jgi:hypothetical protein
MKREFEDVRDAVKDAAREVASGLSMALLGVGASAFGVAEAIKAVKESIVGFASTAMDLKSLSVESRVAIAAIQALQEAAPRFNIAASSVQAGIKTFGLNMRDFSRGVGDAYSQLLGQLGETGLPQHLRKLAEQGKVTGRWTRRSISSSGIASSIRRTPAGSARCYSAATFSRASAIRASRRSANRWRKSARTCVSFPTMMSRRRRPSRSR